MLTFFRATGLYGLAPAAAAVVRRTAVLACLYLVVVVLGIVGLGFLSAAAFMTLSADLGRVYACLIVGCGHLSGAGIALLTAQMRSRR